MGHKEGYLMVFNYTLATNVTSLPGLGTYMNSVTNDVFGLTILGSIFLVSFISLAKTKEEINNTFMVSSWLTFTASLLTLAMGWTSVILTIIFMLAVAVTTFMSFRDDK